MGAAAVAMRERGINIMQSSIGGLIVINLVLTFAIRGISIGGHVGGAIAGAICGAVMLAPAYRRGPSWATWATPVIVGVGSVVAVVMIVNAA
jgi:membrane associated rhomboid family serine protease